VGQNPPYRLGFLTGLTGFTEILLNHEELALSEVEWGTKFFKSVIRLNFNSFMFFMVNLFIFTMKELKDMKK
jgi:hypothetical protein